MPSQIWLVLALAAPAAGLSVHVTPPLDPHGRAWRVLLVEEMPNARKPVDEHAVGVDGRWTSGAPRLGVLYRVQVKTESGDGWYADEKAFEWTGSAEPLEMRLSSSAFRGTLFLGKKRLSARVTFTDSDGLVAVHFSTKTDGTFEGVLPRDGWWNVTVVSDRPHFQTTFDVKVDPVFRDGTPPDVDVRVRNRAIAGEIVDGDNRAVPLSRLHVYGGSRLSDDMDVSGGAFRWERVVDGWMTVHASRRGPTGFETSPARHVRVEGGWVEPGFIALEIRPTYVLHGRAVRATGEPAPGTSVRLLGSTFRTSGLAASDGRFQMTVRGGGENACLLVMDPSKAARLVPVPASQTEQDVPVAEAPGTLSLEFTPRGTRRISALVANGCKLSWFQFRDIPQIASGSTATLMKSTFRASAGAYALCGLEVGDFDEDGEIPPDACVSGTLAPGGTLGLRLNP